MAAATSALRLAYDQDTDVCMHMHVAAFTAISTYAVDTSVDFKSSVCIYLSLSGLAVSNAACVTSGVCYINVTVIAVIPASSIARMCAVSSSDVHVWQSILSLSMASSV